MNSLDDELEFEYWLYEQAVEEAKEEIEDNVVKYVEGQEYSLYEDRFVYDNNCIIRKKKILKYNSEARVCDYFCRFIIDFWANQAKTSVTPKELYGKMIFRGQYTSWKGFFLESSLSDKFGLRRNTFKISGMEDMLDNSLICALILYDCTTYFDLDENDESEKQEELWHIVKKLLKNNIQVEDDVQIDEVKYQIVNLCSELTEGEKNTITILLLNKRLYWHDEEIDIFAGRRGTAIKKEKKVNLSKAEKKDLRRKLALIYDSFEKSEICKSENNFNSDRRQIKVAWYLAPFIAAICEYHQRNPFYVSTNIWKKQDEFKYMMIPTKSESESKKLFEEYVKLNRYVKYKRELESLLDDDELLQKYEEMQYHFVQKIALTKNLKWVTKQYKKDRYVLFYILEKLTGYLFVERVTEILYTYYSRLNNTSENVDKFLREWYILGEILSELYRIDGAIIKVELIEAVIYAYFENKPTDIEAMYKRLRIIRKQIKDTEVDYKIRELIFVQDDLPETDKKIYISEVKAKEISGSINHQSYTDIVHKYFGTYIEIEKQLEQEGDAIGEKKIMALVAEKIKEKNMNEKYQKIKKWVISKCIIAEKRTCFEFI